MLSGFDSNFSKDDEDVLNEFRQKQVNFNVEEHHNDINNSRSLFIGALAGLAMAGIVGWFILAPQYKNSGNEEVPVIRRPQTSVKVLPSDPGGVDISNQEKTVYDIIERKVEDTTKETILPPPEEPNVSAIENLIEEKVVDNSEKTDVVKVESLTAVAKVVVEEKPQALEKIEEKKPIVAEQVKKEPAKAAEPVNLVKKTVVAKTIAEAPKGAWQIQLMSSPNKDAVEKSWAQLVKKYSVLAEQPYEVETADLGAKGIYYRLRAGNFSSKDGATQLCNKLKAAGGSCFVARK